MGILVDKILVSNKVYKNFNIYKYFMLLGVNLFQIKDQVYWVGVKDWELGNLSMGKNILPTKAHPIMLT